jgi:hypothetical protein
MAAVSMAASEHPRHKFNVTPKPFANIPYIRESNVGHILCNFTLGAGAAGPGDTPGLAGRAQ